MKRRGILPALALVLATLVAYIPAMQGGFVWDDDAYVTDNPLLTAPDGLRRIWFSFDSPSQYFPLTYTTFRIERSLWGLQPLGYHVMNVLLHGANALLVWLLLRRLALPGAWLAAALFALHPVNVESVAWITELKNVLSTLFSLFAALAWTRFLDAPQERRQHYYLLGLAAFWLALFSKTTACTLPAGFLIICWLKGETLGRRRLLQVTPFAVSGVAMGLVTLWWERFHQGTRGQEFAFPMAERLIIAGRAIWFYLGKLFWPVDLSFSYTRWTIDPGSPAQYLWPIAALAGIFALWHWRTSLGRGPFAAILFFVASLSPLLGFFPLYTFRYTFVADHYQYVASIGPLALVAAAVGTRWRGPAMRARATLVLCAAALLALGALTWKQGGAYRDAETLWRDTLTKNPGSFMAHNQTGILMTASGKVGEGIKHFLAAQRLKPDHAEAYVNHGNALLATQPEEAIRLFLLAERLDPKHWEIHYNQALAYRKRNQLGEAARKYRDTIALKPDKVEAHHDLGVILLQQGRADEALPHLQEAVRLLPGNAETHFNLGRALAMAGRPTEAAREFREALRINPRHGDAFRRLQDVSAVGAR